MGMCGWVWVGVGGVFCRYACECVVFLCNKGRAQESVCVSTVCVSCPQRKSMRERERVCVSERARARARARDFGSGP